MVLNDAGFEAHGRQFVEHTLAEVALYQYLAAAGTAASVCSTN